MKDENATNGSWWIVQIGSRNTETVQQLAISILRAIQKGSEPSINYR
jgi:hypothetical protein